MAPSTLPEVLAERARLTPAAEAYRQFRTTSGTWVSVTFDEVAQRVSEWRAALRAEGFAAGARVAILVPNSVEHIFMDQAALSLGLVPVPMHMIDQPESLAYVLADSGASLLCIDSASRWLALEPLAAEFPELKRVVYLEGTLSGSPGIARSLMHWLSPAGNGRRDSEASALGAQGEDSTPTPDSLAAIVYTSGTTGRPKGVMLSHRNILANVYAVLARLPLYPGDISLSFLPLSHTLERTIGYYLPMAAGTTVVFARSVQTIMSDLVAVRPTLLVSVPRIYERAYVGIRDSLARRPVSRRAFALAVRIGWKRLQRPDRRGGPLLEYALWPLLDRWVARRVRERFGGRLRAAVTGGAPLPVSVGRTFLALGIPLLQGYGLTESSPVIAANEPGSVNVESVGAPLPGLEVKVGEQQELLVRGPSVMVGYWHRPEDTARALDPDGWLHTGDQAAIEDGRLYIRGRIKEIIVTSTGEKIAPADLESAILTDPLFEQVMVIGEAKPYLAALVVLNREQWTREARELGLSTADPAALQSRAARDRALERINRALRAFPGYARPRAASLSLDPWTVEAGLLTPTLKPKRRALENRFAEEIRGLYRGHDV